MTGIAPQYLEDLDSAMLATLIDESYKSQQSGR